MTELRRDWYRMGDVENRGAIPIDAANRAELLNQANDWNRKGHGIFWTLNEFNGARQIPNLKRINAWAVDMDEGTKEEQRARLHRSPLVPSCVIETKRGYQAYFNAKDGRAEHWNALVLDRLVPFFGADKNARDLARILRVPGFLHLKDPANPFKVRIVHGFEVSYSEMQLAQAFPDHGKHEREVKEQRTIKREVKFKDSDGFWDRVWQLDCEEGLRRIGPEVGESYTFKRNANGCKNILVDGKGSSCWIDKNGRIGSLSKGGPTLYNWLVWFGKQPRDAVSILKRAFPQLESK